MIWLAFSSSVILATSAFARCSGEVARCAQTGAAVHMAIATTIDGKLGSFRKVLLTKGFRIIASFFGIFDNGLFDYRTTDSR